MQGSEASVGWRLHREQRDYLEEVVLDHVGASNSSTIVFPAPIDLLQPLIERMSKPPAPPAPPKPE